jgi:inorganic pyrophosphatase
MSDDKGLDDKIISVHIDDPSYRHYTHIRELPPHTLLELKRFFEDYKILENKKVTVQEFQGPEQAFGVIRAGLEGYTKRQSAGGKAVK